MDLGQVIQALRLGEKVGRKGWNGKGMWLIYREGGDHILVDKEYYQESPYIAMKTVDGKLVPWLANQTDILATDWEIV